MYLLPVVVLLLQSLASLGSARHFSNVFKRAQSLHHAAGKEARRILPRQELSGPGAGLNVSTFLTDKTRPFAVDGKKIPQVPLDMGESYAGLLPVSDDPNETRKLFFWFWPSLNTSRPQEIAIWFNGGPGCSSLIGLITENGPFMWQAGTEAPKQNRYDWRNLTNVMWVEQPVGTGFTQGKPNATNEEESANQFIGFYHQFAETFDVKGYEIFLTGESYAGYYLPYIANEFIKQNDSNYPLTAVHINNPIIGADTVQIGATVAPFVEYWSNLLGLNSTARRTIAAMHESCGYKDFLAKWFTYPAAQKPFPTLKEIDDDKCDTFTYLTDAYYEVNPCVSPYSINLLCPTLSSVTGHIGDGVPGDNIYFNRTDVQELLHVPPHTAWEECSHDPVFPNPNNASDPYDEDQSEPPANNGVLQNVIETTNRVIIGSGNLDSLLNTNGTLVVLQNLTWNGWQGFENYPGQDFISPAYDDLYTSTSGHGVVGKWGSERGLTFYQIQQAGHMVPGAAQGPSFRVMELLLGRIDNLGEHTPFTTDVDKGKDEL